VGAGDSLHLVWQDWAKSGDNWYPETVRYATGHDDNWSNDNAGVVVHTYVDASNPPEVAVSTDGTVVVTWIEGSAVLASTSSDGGQSWSSPELVAADALPVSANPENDLRTPPSVFTPGLWHLVYENANEELMHVLEGTSP
jgi:hypothetical protein